MKHRHAYTCALLSYWARTIKIMSRTKNILLKFWNFKILWKFSIFILNPRILKFVENFEISEIFWNLLKILKFLKFFENFEIMKIFEFFWNFEIFWKFWIFLKFWNFVKISEFSLIDDEVRVFRINIKLLSNPVAELKIRENDSHCRSIVLKIMDRSTTGKGKK